MDTTISRLTLCIQLVIKKWNVKPFLTSCIRGNDVHIVVHCLLSCLPGVTRVDDNKNHKINGACVQVKPMKPAPYVPLVEGPWEERVIQLSGLSPLCTEDDLKTFFTMANACGEIKRVKFCQTPGIAMLQFAEPPGNAHVSAIDVPGTSRSACVMMREASTHLCLLPTIFIIIT